MSEKMDFIPAHLDGWYNIVTGMGMAAYDKRVSTSFTYSEKLDDQTLIDLYQSEGIGRRMIEVPIGDMVRNWLYIENDTDNKVVRYLSKISVKKYIKSALRWSQLFGGSMLFIGIDDGQKADKPVREDLIQGIRFFEVFDKRDISWQPDDLYSDAANPLYGKPEWYTVNRHGGIPVRLHESRCLTFYGEDVPEQERTQNQGWGDSRLQAIFTRLRGVCDSLAGVENINTEFILGVMKISNLQGLLASKEGEQILRNRLKSIDLVKHQLNTIAIDKNEEYERASSFGVSGLRELIDILIDVICGMSGIPRVKLIGDQAKGLGGEAAGNVRMYYDEIAAQQEDNLGPQLNKLFKYAMISKECFGQEIDGWRIIFNKLWQPTEKEEAEIRLLNAKTDVLYVQNGIPAEYIIISRFGGQSYGLELTLPQEYIDVLKKMSPEELIKKAEERMEAGKKSDTGKDHEEGDTGAANPGDKTGAR